MSPPKETTMFASELKAHPTDHDKIQNLAEESSTSENQSSNTNGTTTMSTTTESSAETTATVTTEQGTTTPPPCVKPTAVNELKVLNTSSSSITLSWTAPVVSCEIQMYRINYTGYILWGIQSEVNGLTDTINSTEPNVEYTVTDLQPYAYYNFSVVFVTEAGESEPASVDGKTEQAAPSEPRKVTAVSNSSRTIQVSWTPPEQENGVLLNYSISWINDFENRSESVGDTEYIITSLEPCVDYFINVKAQTSAGYGPPGHATATTQTDVPPEVTDLIGTNVTSTSIALSWSRPDTECDITGYNVSYYGEILWGDGGWDNDSRSVNGSQEYVEIDGLTPYTQYTITVVASTEAGPGMPSDLIITTDEAYPSEVRNLMANSTSPTEVFVSWEIPEEENGILSDYLITWDDGSGDNQSAEVNTTSFLIEGLIPCVLYNITVKAQTGAGYGEESYIDATTDSDVPPEVTDLIGTNVTSTTIALSWSTPDTECDITGYSVSYYGEILWGDGNWVNGSRSVNGSQEYVEIVGLTPYTQYSITVVASTEAGPGMPSDLIITTDEAYPSEVRNLMANSTNSTEIFVSWEIPEEENGILGDYLITWDDGSGDNQSAEVNTTSFLIEGLFPCVLYNITVKAQTGAGYGEESYIDATTDSDVPPEVTDLIDTNVTSTSIALSWSTPDTECDITGYNVSYYGKLLWGNGSWVNGSCSVNSSEESYVITDLIPYTEYTITVVASTAVGPGKPSEPLVTRTLESHPSEVRNLMANSTSATEIFVSWEVPEEENGILGDYLITWRNESGDNQSAEVNDTSFLIGGMMQEMQELIACVLYDITVKAQTGAGYGEESYTNETTETEVPPEVTDLTCTNATNTSISLSWSRPATYCVITNYSVSYYGEILWGNRSWENRSVPVNGDEEYVEIDGLTPYTEYTITVVAWTEEGPGSSSKLVNSTQEAHPSEVRNLTAISSGPKEVFVSWEVPEEENGILGDYLITWVNFQGLGEEG
ncbi:phosphatidylinositol phosphatase PTPRQ [Hyalella azteca]|uniref:Phosphatidylinositol phosphatase PTPRQ n=1 Tax=Hyalella azteca TaxID=294128 RepID=A0A8B7NU89_HYAAZ|nr:phosphatidylinositol phosphatase PTPRQ [Hyalella azteca]